MLGVGMELDTSHRRGFRGTFQAVAPHPVTEHLLYAGTVLDPGDTIMNIAVRTVLMESTF